MRRFLLFLTIVILVGAAACAPPHRTSLTSDAADPDVTFDGRQYVLHTTNTPFGNVPTYTSPDLVSWHFTGDALPVLPAWADRGYTWAPAGIRRADGSWVLYFSAAVRGRRTPNGQPLKCLGVAASPTAVGPYSVPREWNAVPFLCSPGVGTIDPAPFRPAPTAVPELVAKVDGNAAFLPTRIETRRLAADLTSFAPGAPTTLLTSTTGTWEGRIVEAPDLLTAGGRLHLVYSGGDFARASYGEGQALCTGTTRSCVRNGRLLDAPLYGTGAGGASEFLGAGGVSYLAWHAYADGNVRAPRRLSIGALTVTPAGVLGVGAAPVRSTSATASDSGTVGAARARPGAPTIVELTVPEGAPVTVPNAHPR